MQSSGIPQFHSCVDVRSARRGRWLSADLRNSAVPVGVVDHAAAGAHSARPGRKLGVELRDSAVPQFRTVRFRIPLVRKPSKQLFSFLQLLLL
jgi:hypothetical protein